MLIWPSNGSSEKKDLNEIVYDLKIVKVLIILLSNILIHFHQKKDGLLLNLC